MSREFSDAERLAYLERRAKVVRRNGDGWLVLGHELGEVAYRPTLRDTVDAILGLMAAAKEGGDS